MAKKKKRDIRELAKKEIREDQIESGYFDGRFVERSEKPKKAYKRNKKHKGKDLED